MTVHEAPMANGHHNVDEEEATGTATSKDSRRSCFFEWEILPQHRIEGLSERFLCDLCNAEVDGNELNLKLHQIGLHINPYYLSASDRILAQISSYAVQTDKTEGPWVPDWDTFKVRPAGLTGFSPMFMIYDFFRDFIAATNVSYYATTVLTFISTCAAIK